MASKLVIEDPEQACRLFEAARDYRQEKFDTRWDKCLEHDEGFRGNVLKDRTYGTVRSDDGAMLVDLQLPLVQLFNQRKVAMLSQFSISPDVFADSTSIDNIAEVREAVLSWGLRTSNFKSALVDVIPDLVTIGIGWLRLHWDRHLLGGLGAPIWLKRSVKSVFVDPMRRDQDINRDCRWVFEVMSYTESDLRQYWPKHFEAHPPAGSLTETASVENSSTDTVTSSDEGNRHEIIVMEYLVEDMETGKLVCRVGMLDYGNRIWIDEEPPRDNGLGRYSYLPVNNRCERDRAYPTPPNEKELPLGNIVSSLISQAMEAALRMNGAPLMYDIEDPAQQKAFDTDKGGKQYFEPYTTIGFHGTSSVKPYFLTPPNPNNHMDIAERILGLVMENAEISQVQRGQAPEGVTSGVAIGRLQSYADIPIDIYRDARDGAASIGLQALDAIIQSNITSTRQIYVQNGQDRSPLQLMVPLDSKGAPDLLKDEKAKKYVSAAWIHEGDEKYGSLEEGQASGQPIVVFLNDLRAGRLEIAAQILPERSQQDRELRVDSLVTIGSKAFGQPIVDPLYYMREKGVENATGVLEQADQRNQVLQVGQAAMQNPVVMQMLQDPSLAQEIGLLIQSTQQPTPGLNGTGQPARREQPQGENNVR